ncbi:MAG: hypothetical protein ABJN57_14235 [Hyphomicrobiales bacterium]
MWASEALKANSKQKKGFALLQSPFFVFKGDRIQPYFMKKEPSLFGWGTWQRELSGAQDQPERSEVSADKLI